MGCETRRKKQYGLSAVANRELKGIPCSFFFNWDDPEDGRVAPTLR
jgi:hypothetical protein